MAATKNILHELPICINKELILSVLHSEGVVLNNIKIKKVNASRFFSSLYLIEAQSSTNKEFNLYLKCSPENDELCGITKCLLQFQTEMVLYQNIIPAFKELQRENTPQVTRPPLSLPYCYAAERSEENYMLILKDMCTPGYVLLDHLKPMELPELISVFKQVGRFHGFSLVMKMKAPEEFKKITETLVEPTFVSPQYENFYRDTIIDLLEEVRSIIKDYYEVGSVYLKKYDKFMERISALLPQQVKTDPSNEPYNVITHGDIWFSNMLFHYDKVGNVPDDICFLDFQQVRYSSPAIDLYRCLYVLTDKETRDKNREFLFRCYHDSVSQTLDQFGLNVEYIFPFSELETQFRKCSGFIAALSIFTLVVCLCAIEGKVLSDNKTESLGDTFKKMRKSLSADCRKRVFDVIEEFVMRGYMDSDSE